MKCRFNIFILTVTICTVRSLANESCLKSAKTSSGRAAYLTEDETDNYCSDAKTESMKSQSTQTEVTVNSIHDDEFNFSNFDSDFENLSSYFDEDNELSCRSYTKETSSQKTIEVNTEQISEINDFNRNTPSLISYAKNSVADSFLERSEKYKSTHEHEEMEDISSKIERLMEGDATSGSEESSSSSSEESTKVPCHHSQYQNEETYEETFINEYGESSLINSLNMEDDISSTPMMGSPPRLRPGMNLPFGQQFSKSLPSSSSNIPKGPTSNRPLISIYEFENQPHKPQFPTLPSPKSSIMPEYSPLRKLPTTLPTFSPARSYDTFSTPISSPYMPELPESSPQITSSAPLAGSLISENENLTLKTFLSNSSDLPNGINSLQEVETYQRQLKEEEEAFLSSNIPLNLPLTSEEESSQEEKIHEIESVVSENIPSSVSPNIVPKIEINQQQESEILKTESVQEKIPTVKISKPYIPPLLPTKSTLPRNIPSPIPSNINPAMLTEIEEYQEHESESDSVLESIPSTYTAGSVLIPNSQTGNENVFPLPKPSLPINVPSYSIPLTISPNTLSGTEAYEEQESEVLESESIRENVPSSYSPSNMLSEIDAYQEQGSEVMESESILENKLFSPESISVLHSQTGAEYISPLLSAKVALPSNIPSPTPSNIPSKMLSEIEEYQKQKSESESTPENIFSPHSPNNVPILYSQTGNEYISPLFPMKPSLPENIPRPIISSTISPNTPSEIKAYQEQESQVSESESIQKSSLHSSPISNYYSSAQNRYSPSNLLYLKAPHMSQSQLPYSEQKYCNNLPFSTTPHIQKSTVPYPYNPSPSSHNFGSNFRPYFPIPSRISNLQNYSKMTSQPYTPTHISNTPFKGYTSQIPRALNVNPQISPQFQLSPSMSSIGTKSYWQQEKPYEKDIIPKYPKTQSSSTFPPEYVFADVEEIFEEAKQQIYNSYSAYPTNVVEMIDKKEVNYLSYHVVILGSGPAALQAAKIFSECGKRTLIIETCLVPPYKSTSMYYRPNLLSSEYVTSYPATIPGTNIEKIFYASNTVGNTDSIGENVWDLGTTQKYREWGNLSEKWSWSSLSQYYNIEKIAGEGSETFLVGGAIPLSRSFPDSPVTKRLTRALAELGFDEVTYELNSPRQSSGMMIVPTIYDNGGTTSYIQKIFEQIVNREYVHIALGLKLVDINFENDRAVGIVVITPWKTIVTIDIEFELIIGGNIVDTVKWLYQCGIGDKNTLQQLQIPVRQHIPYLGKHVNFSPTFTGILCKFPQGTLVNEFDSSDYAGLEYIFGQNRIQPVLSSIYFKVFAQLHDAVETNVQFNFYAFSHSMSVRLFDFMNGRLQFTEEIQQFVFEQLADGDVIFILPQLVDATSSGEIKISRTENDILPIIDTGIYRSERDLKMMIKAVELIQKLAQTKTFKTCGGKLLQIPVPQCGRPSFSQTYNECSIRHLSVPNIDITGGGCMGHDRHTSVVNDDLKIHGFQNVRLFNSAVIPFGTGSHSLAIEHIIGNIGAHLTLKNYSK